MDCYSLYIVNTLFTDTAVRFAHRFHVTYSKVEGSLKSLPVRAFKCIVKTSTSPDCLRNTRPYKGI